MNNKKRRQWKGVTSALCAGYVNRYICECEADQTKSNMDINVDENGTTHPSHPDAGVVMKEGSSWMRTSSDKVPLWLQVKK